MLTRDYVKFTQPEFILRLLNKILIAPGLAKTQSPREVYEIPVASENPKGFPREVTLLTMGLGHILFHYIVEYAAAVSYNRLLEEHPEYLPSDQTQALSYVERTSERALREFSPQFESVPCGYEMKSHLPDCLK